MSTTNTKESRTLAEAESVYVHSMGKALRVSALCFGEDAANAYMERHEAAALVACCGPFCLLADKHDKGVPLHAPKREARIAELERTLAAVTAQRDQCREALRVSEVAADQAAAYVADECPGAWGDAYSEALTSAAMQARAALRACDEKRSAEGASIAGGA